MTDFNWDNFCAELSAIEMIKDQTQVKKLSQDYYHFSPILQQQLQDKIGDIVVCPATEAEILLVAKVCVKYKIPLTVSGGGNGKLWTVYSLGRGGDFRYL